MVFRLAGLTLRIVRRDLLVMAALCSSIFGMVAICGSDHQLEACTAACERGRLYD